MSNHVRAYQLQSSDDINAKQVFKDFAADHNFRISRFYADSKAIKGLDNSALLRLLNNCNSHDVLLIKDTSILASLSADAWQQLARSVQDKQLRVVVIELPITWQQVTDDADSRVSYLLIEVLVDIAIAAKMKRKQLQSAGINKAKLKGKYEGRKPDLAQYQSIINCLSDGMTYKEIEAKLGCSSRTIVKAKKWQAAGAAGVEL